MSEAGLRPWQLVSSEAGRDRNEWYLIVGLGDGVALVADGRRRRVERPKRKNLRHLRGYPVIAAGLAQLAASGQVVTDEQVRASLQALVEDLEIGAQAPEAEREDEDGAKYEAGRELE
jgi:myosin-crossreactive antigen